MFVSKNPGKHISEPTRYRFGEEPSLLDLVLTNEEGMVLILEYQSGLGNSDHLLLIFELVCQEELNKETGTQPDFFKTVFVSVRNALKNINWEDKLSRNFAESYEQFMVIVTTAIDKYVPKRTMRHRKKYSIYMSNEAMTLKTRSNDCGKSTQLRDDYDNFVKCKNNLRKLTRSLKEVFERKLAINSKNKPKPFWSYVFFKLKTRVRIPTLSKVDGGKSTNCTGEGGSIK